MATNNRKAERKNVRDLKLQLLISESEKQVAEFRLQSLSKADKSRIYIPDPKPPKDEEKRKQKVGELLIQLLTLIDSNTSLQYLLEIGSLESLTKIYDQGKCFKLLKKILKPFTLLIKYLLNTNLTDGIEQSIKSQQQFEVTPIQINHEHKISLPSTLNKYSQLQSEVTTPEISVKITKQTQTHNDPLHKKHSMQIEQAPKLKRSQIYKTQNCFKSIQQ